MSTLAQLEDSFQALSDEVSDLNEGVYPEKADAPKYTVPLGSVPLAHMIKIGEAACNLAVSGG